jgi:hypothetical protein
LILEISPIDIFIRRNNVAARWLAAGFARLRAGLSGHARTVVASALMLVMPFLLVGSCNMVTIADLGHVAGTIGGGLLRDNPVLAHMSEKEQARYARTLADLLDTDPQAFLKFADVDVELLLREPGLKRADGPVQVWQYRNENCVLDLYIGKDADRDIHHVIDYEIRERVKARMGGHDGGAVADAACLRSVIAAHSAEPPVVMARLF